MEERSEGMKIIWVGDWRVSASVDVGVGEGVGERIDGRIWMSCLWGKAWVCGRKEQRQWVESSNHFIVCTGTDRQTHIIAIIRNAYCLPAQRRET